MAVMSLIQILMYGSNVFNSDPCVWQHVFNSDPYAWQYVFNSDPYVWE